MIKENAGFAVRKEINNCIVCKDKDCVSEVHKYVTRHNLYYDKDGKLKISKSGINYIKKYEKHIQMLKVQRTKGKDTYSWNDM